MSLSDGMSSSRPYLIRALYEWIVDNGFTPYLMVDATQAGVVVPSGYVQEGKIVLNISPQAIAGLDMSNDFIRFNARFSGSPLSVEVPTGAVLAIYAKENGQGMAFPGGSDQGPEPPDQPSGPDKPRSGRPNLKVVK